MFYSRYNNKNKIKYIILEKRETEVGTMKNEK